MSCNPFIFAGMRDVFPELHMFCVLLCAIITFACIYMYTSKNKLVNVITIVNISTNVCHNAHYFCVVTFTSIILYSDRHYIQKISEGHYLKTVSIEAEISSEIHYNFFTVYVVNCRPTSSNFDELDNKLIKST